MKNILLIGILLLAFPAGYLLAWLARDELLAGRKWFLALAIFSILAAIPVAYYVSFRLPVILTLFFIAIICLIAIWKSYDKTWKKK